MSDLYPENPVLLVDDEIDILNAFSEVLRFKNINNILTCRDSRKVMDLLKSRTIEVLLLDLSMPHISGQKLLPEIREKYPDLPIIIVTGTTEVSTAVDCMKMGVFDYLVKAVESSKLTATVDRAIEIQGLKRENIYLKEKIRTGELANPAAFREIITKNQKMHSLFLYMETIAPTSQTILITGETGTGKELTARAMHDLSGRKGNYIAVNVAGFDDTLFSDTLFGHKKGAYTGAMENRKGLVDKASQGTLFLDEIGDLNKISQQKLLRLLENQEYLPLGADIPQKSEARIIVATNKNINEAVNSGEFRKDLFFRLNTFKVHIPPLRERRDDLPFLVEYFLQEAAKEFGKKKPTVPSELYTLLNVYSFPGNIRELKSLITEAVSKHRGGKLSLDVFRGALGKTSEDFETKLQNETVIFPSVLPSLKKMSDLLIDEALKRAEGNQSVAARMLGISPQALSKRLKQK